MALKKGAKFSSIKIISCLERLLPSIEAVNIMLDDNKNRLSLSSLLKIVTSAGCRGHHSSKITKELILQRDEIIKMALEKGANPNEIMYFTVLPTKKLSKLLLSYKLNPDKYSSLISRMACMEYNRRTGKYELNDKLLKRKKSLFEFAKQAYKLSISEPSESYASDFVNLLSTLKSCDNPKVALEARDKNGRTLLMLAAASGFMNWVDVLLVMQPDLNNEERKKVYTLAENAGNPKVYLDDLKKLLKL